eukprot:gb/GEZN01004112.1/.p1 GENE.gb/GEZN01004112.1/~~gb/GEZN01004112.1/.p1  ORF type:complete len:449 (+),score=42.21 gb/GEZN01004112.1/:64-1410(+)
MAMICSACGLDLSARADDDGEDRLRFHYKSDWHRYNIKLKVAGLAAIPELVFTQKVATLLADKQSNDRVYRCEVCSKMLKSASAYKRHVETKSHLKRLQRVPSRGASVQAVSSSADTNGGVRATSSASIHSTSGTFSSGDSMTKSVPSVSSSMSLSSLTELPKTDVTKPAAAVAVKTCLFCPKQFRAVRASVLHMLHDHGMFIPFSEYLHDLHGLLGFLGSKVGQGHVCLWCNKQSWASLEAVRSHMRALGHCKIRLDTEDDEEELIDFYTFPKPGDIDKGVFRLRRSIYDTPLELPGLLLEGMTMQSEQEVLSKLLQAEADANRRASEPKDALSTHVQHIPASIDHMNEFGELVLTDGRRIGHRQYLQVYRQNLRDASSRGTGGVSRMSGRLISMLGVTDTAMQKRAKSKAYLDRLRYYASLADYRARVGQKRQFRPKKSAYLDYGC